MNNFDPEDSGFEYYRKFIRDNIEALCKLFFSNGKKVGSGWYIGNVTGDAGNSLEIALEPYEKAGLWLDRATDEEKGDFISLIQQSVKAKYGKELSFAETLQRIFAAKPSAHGRSPSNIEAYRQWWTYTSSMKDACNKERLAKERGYSLECIEKIVNADLIGLSGGNWVFPIHHEGVVVAVHKKAGDAWFIEPKGLGIGIPPLVYGSLSQAEEVHIFESQWDMFALIDLLKSHSQQKIAFAATRGSKNVKAIEEILGQLKKSKPLYPWSQRDAPDNKGIKAGEVWLDKVFGVASEMGLNLKPCWIPNLHPKKNFDLNDWLREGATCEQAEEIIGRAETVEPRGKHLKEESVRRVEWYRTEYEKKPGPMREEAFYGLAGEITRICVANSECSPEAILVQFLILFGNIIGRYAYASGGSKKLFTNEYGVILGPTAYARKGTSLAEARLPLKLIDPYWSKFCVKSGLASGEGLIHHIRDPMPTRGGRGLDPGIADKRFQNIEEEFAQTVAISLRSGNTLTAVIRKAWDSPDSLDITTRNSPARASHPHVSFIGHITREELLELDLKNISGELVNRFL